MILGYHYEIAGKMLLVCDRCSAVVYDHAKHDGHHALQDQVLKSVLELASAHVSE